MRTLIIYDSFFGNTQKIAEAIGKSIDGSEVIRIDDVKEEELKNVDLLVIGSPTRGFMPSEKMTAFLKELGNLNGIKVAAFDTRIDMNKTKSAILRFFFKLCGAYAADTIAKNLKSKGGELVTEQNGFIVMDTEGPLMDGEEKRAQEWGKKIS